MVYAHARTRTGAARNTLFTVGRANPEEQGMMHWIRAAARAIREERGRKPVHIAAERNVNESTITRFEAGKTTNIDVDSLVAAYSRDTEVPAIEFWRRAVEMWQTALKATEPGRPTRRR